MMLNKTVIEKWPIIGSLIIVFFIYCFSPYFGYWFDSMSWNDKRALETAFIAVAITLLICVPRYRQACLTIFPMGNDVVRYCFLGLLFFALVSSIQADYPLRAMQDVGLMAGLVLLGVCIWLELKPASDDQLHRIISLTFLGATFVMVASFISYYILLVQEPKVLTISATHRWVPNFANPRFYNHVQVWVIPLASWCLLVAWQRQSKLLIVGLVSALSLWWTIMFFTLGRGIFWSLMLGLVAILLVKPKKALQLGGAVMSTLAIGGILYSVMFVLIPLHIHGDIGLNYISRIATLDDSGRLHLWSVAVQLMAENPLWGVGAQHYAVKARSFGSAHNMWLNWGAEQGVMSLLLLVIMVLLVVKRFYEVITKTVSPFVLFVAWQFAAMLLYSCFTGLWITPFSQILMAFSCALYGKVLATNNGFPSAVTQPKVGAKIIFVLLLLLSMVFVAITFWDLLTLSETISSQPYTPRFWLNGYYFFQ